MVILYVFYVSVLVVDGYGTGTLDKEGIRRRRVCYGDGIEVKSWSLTSSNIEADSLYIRSMKGPADTSRKIFVSSTRSSASRVMCHRPHPSYP